MSISDVTVCECCTDAVAVGDPDGLGDED